MRPRTPGLYADVERIVELKLRIPTMKELAIKHRVKVQTIRKLVSAALQRRKSTLCPDTTDSDDATLP